jgi:hypothetical protein
MIAAIRHAGSAALVALLLCSSAASMHADGAGQAGTAAAGRAAAERDIVDLILAKLIELQNEAPPTAGGSDDAVARAMADVPRAAPTAKQVTAPSAAPSSGSVTDAPSFPEIIALALDNNLVGTQNGVFTVDLNVFVFRTIADPRIIERQDQYGTPLNGVLRRFGGAVSVGGKGERFDRDGNGSPDEAVTADNLGDLITGEVRYRIAGSRDRRDGSNFERYAATVMEPIDEVNDAIVAFIARHQPDISARSVPVDPADPNAGRKPDPKKIDAFLSEDAVKAELRPIALAHARLMRINREALKKIDQRAVWTIVAGGTRQKSRFGPNRERVALRGVAGTGPWDHTVNVEWGHAEPVLQRPAGTTWRAAYGASRLVFQGTLSEQGVTLSLNAGGEHVQNVPDAKHDTIVRASVKLEIPFGSARIPVSLNYANHRDLLSDQRYVAGYVGVALDLSALSRRK